MVPLLSQTAIGNTTNYTLDIAAGLTQVLSDGTSTYLYGRGRIGEEQPGGWQYPLGDALGSVRQLTDSDGYVMLVKAYEPFGSVLSTTGDAGTNYGFTGEWTDGTGLVHLRARYYAPESGRFMTKDVWEGDPNQPMSYNAWLYGYANPTLWVDRTGLSPKVDCAKMPTYRSLRRLCEIGNGDDDDPTVLDAREEILRIMVDGGHLYGLVDEGFYWAAEMLEHFLDGNGSSKHVPFSMYNQFPHDPGITRATKEERSPRPDLASDEPAYIRPLLHEFVYNHIQSAADGGSWFKVVAELHGKDYYEPRGTDTYPRPYNTGFWAAFGHVVIDGRISAVVQHSCTYDGYFAEYTANYRIEDQYAWYPEKGMWTPFYFPFAPGVIEIPHHWEESLTVTNPPRADEYDFTISWTERERIFITGDFSYFREVEWWEWESQYPNP